VASGSRDLVSATDKMSAISTGHNVDAAHRAFVMLMCARVFVLNCFLEQIPPGTSAETARRHWVLIQVMSPFDSIEEIFTNVLGVLRGAHKTDMMDFTKAMLRDIREFCRPEFFPRQGLFAVVDEAQVAAEYLNGVFRSSTTENEECPVLHPFFRFLWKSELFKGVILVGTGLSMKMVRTAVLSHGGARLQFRQDPYVFIEVGRFTKNGEEHRAYVNKYLHLSTSVSDERLRDRISYWFHGWWVHRWSFQRKALILNPSSHQFTADLIELLLCAPPGSPHRILSALVHSLTGFNLTDATDLEEGEPPITTDIHDQIMHYGPIIGDKILEHRTYSGQLPTAHLNI
jgi:hypothetical protein